MCINFPDCSSKVFSFSSSFNFQTFIGSYVIHSSSNWPCHCSIFPKPLQYPFTSFWTDLTEFVITTAIQLQNHKLNLHGFAETSWWFFCVFFSTRSLHPLSKLLLLTIALASTSKATPTNASRLGATPATFSSGIIWFKGKCFYTLRKMTPSRIPKFLRSMIRSYIYSMTYVSNSISSSDCCWDIRENNVFVSKQKFQYHIFYVFKCSRNNSH